VNSINGLSFIKQGRASVHRKLRQSVFDSYLREEVVPFHLGQLPVAWQLPSPHGASFGAYHAANSLFKHPDVIKRCFAMSGVYDLKTLDGMFDDNFYSTILWTMFPISAILGLSANLLRATFTSPPAPGQWENSGPTYRFSENPRQQRNPHSLDNWGPMGGHDWPYWKHQMREYVAQLF